MKQSLLLIGLATVLFSCQSEVEKLEAEKDELKASIAEDTKRLEEVIHQLDSLSDGVDETDYPDVTIATADKKIFEHYITVQGAIEAGKMVMVVPETGGLIKSLPVKAKEGQVVNEGELLATFDSDVIASNMKELDEQIELAQYLYDKQKSLYDQGVGTELQMKQAEGQLKTLQQTKKSLQTQAGKFKLYAPFTGVVEEVYVVEGQMAGPSTAIIMLVGQKDRKVVAEVSEAYLPTLNEGAKVNAEFPMLKQKVEGLKVSRVGGYVDPVNRTIQLEVDLPEPTSKMVPNLVANLNVRDMVDSAAVVIPSKVVMKGADKDQYVYVVEKNADLSNDSIQRYNVVKQTLKTGASYDGEVVVLEGLKIGQMIIERGRTEVYEGNVVEITEE